jgi:hypothetical protein
VKGSALPRDLPAVSTAGSALPSDLPAASTADSALPRDLSAVSTAGSALPRDLPAVSKAHVSTALPAPPFLLIPAPLRQFWLGQAVVYLKGQPHKIFTSGISL